jgi:hypothetical protein
VYSAERAGMRSVEFSYQPAASGPRETASFKVRVRWSKGQRETIEFLRPDGTPFAEMPEILSTPAAREAYERGARELLSMFRGVPYSERFAKWRKRLDVQTVNGREEKAIVCEPVVPGALLRIEIAIDRKDLPWRIVGFLARPEAGFDRVIEEPAWSEFDEKLLMTSWKQTKGAVSEQKAVQYQRKDGFIVPSSYEQTVAGKPSLRTIFEDVKVSK